MSGEVRSVICSWMLPPCSCVEHLCSLGLCWEAAGWAGIQYPLLCIEKPLKFSSLTLKPFLQAMTFIFSISFVSAQPHSPASFLLVFKKEKCSTAGTSQVKAKCWESNLFFGLLN